MPSSRIKKLRPTKKTVIGTYIAREMRETPFVRASEKMNFGEISRGVKRVLGNLEPMKAENLYQTAIFSRKNKKK